MSRISVDEMRQLLKVYFIMGSNNCKENPLKIAEEAFKAGVTLFQFREKGNGALTGEAKYHFAKELQHLCKQYNVPFIVNDDVELALELDADGIHIGQDDEAAEEVRKKLGDKILGVSAHNMEEARQAIENGADYIGIGPVFPTSTKEDAKEVQGTSVIRILKENGITIPIVGIGGITPENAESICEAGSDGVSVITAISHASSPSERVQKLKQAVERGIANQT